MIDESTPAFITGGTGFVGTHFRDFLSERNIPVTLLVREDQPVTITDNETVQRGDVTDPESFSVVDHEVVIHLAAQTSVDTAISEPRETWKVNAEGTLNVLESARNNNVERILFTSTASIYGPPEYLPIDETHPPNPAEPYGASKLAGDGLARSYASAYDLDIVVARVFNAFGPGQSPHNVVSTIISQALEGGKIELGNLSPSRDFIFIADVIRALFTILEDGESGTAYNVGRGEAVSIREIAEMVIENVEPELEIVSTSDRQRSDDVEIPKHIAEVSRLRKLGWRPKFELKKGLQMTYSANKR